MDARYVRQVRCSERTSGGLDDGAFVGPWEGQCAHCEPDGASLDHRGGGMVAEHAGSYYRARSLLRPERAKGFCKVPREAEERHRKYTGPSEPYASQLAGSARA